MKILQGFGPERIAFAVLAILCLLLFSCESDKSKQDSATDISTGTTLFEKINRVNSRIQFSNTITENATNNYFSYNYFYNGGGVATGDVNRDGLIDIYFSGNQVSNKLYLNKGNFEFEDVTRQSGTGVSGLWSTGVSMVDINADGWLDIYVCIAGKPQNPEQRKNLLYINQKDGTFKEMAEAMGLADFGYSTQAYFWDFDKDNDVDVYIVNHRVDFSNNSKISSEIARDIRPETSDQLYRNDNGRFTNITASAGIANKAWGLSASVADYDGDGWEDIYVANDFLEPDMLFINQKNGTFLERAKELMKHISFYGMGSDVADINNDGLLDLYVLDMVSEDHVRSKRNMASMSNDNFWNMVKYGFHYQYMLNTLQLNNGQGSFSEISNMARVAQTDWSWAPLIADFDQDGYQDIFVTNGIKRDVTDNDFKMRAQKVAASGEELSADRALGLMTSARVKNYAFRNRGDLIFSQAQKKWGLDDALNSNGAMYADFDNDGDLDLVVNNLDAPASIYKNNCANDEVLRIRLIGPPSNPDGIGAQIYVVTDEFVHTSAVYPCRGFMSSGIGDIIIATEKKAINTLEIVWSDGKRQHLKEIPHQDILEISYTNAIDKAAREKKSKLFSEADDNLGITHLALENNHDDFTSEILLPHRQSRLGPAMATGDMNGDNYEDLIFGGPFGQERWVYLQNKEGKFQASKFPGSNKEDVDCALFDADNDGDLDVYFVCGGNEFKPGTANYQDELWLNNGTGAFTKSAALPTMPISGRSVAFGDLEGDGDMDLFIGGGSRPQNYPESENSFLLRNDNGKFTDITPESLRNPGILSTAVWHDLDTDGDQDLIMAGEWTPVMWCENNDGQLGAPRPLSGANGWYQSLHVTDIDGNGKMDILVGNIGLNNKFHPEPNKPLHLYQHDFDDNGSKDIVLSKDKGSEKLPVRGRECSSQQMPFILEKFPTYQAFAEANLSEIYGDQLDQALHLEAHVFSHLAFMQNQSGSYKSVVLPNAMQRSPVMGFQEIEIADSPYFLYAGNFYPAEVETVRYDAGIGGLMAYTNNEFTTLSPEQTGLYLDADIRKIEVIELANNKQAVIAASNNGAVQVFVAN